jgi:hypothetical protein
MNDPEVSCERVAPVGGTGFDLDCATRGYVSVPFDSGFAAVHLIAVASGVALLRQGSRRAFR